MNDSPQFDIIVNAEEVTVTGHRLTFEEVVRFAVGADAENPDKSFTVTYRKSAEDKHDGTLVEGQEVKIKVGTIFNVSSTTRS
jgi:ribosomal protein L13